MKLFNKILLPESGFKGRISAGIDSADTHRWLEQTFASRAAGAEFIVSNEDRKVLSLDAPECLTDGRGKSRVCFKVYIHEPNQCRLSDMYKIFRAAIVWKVFVRLFKMGLPVPEPLAFLSEHVDGKRYQVLMYRYLEGETLTEFAAEHFAQCGFSERRRLIAAVAYFVAGLHRAGVYHGDFHAGNILIHRKNGECRCFLIDVDAVRSIYFISRRRRIKNLDELGRNFLDLNLLSTSDRMFFLREYLKESGDRSLSLKQLFALVYKRTSLRMSKHKLSWQDDLSVNSSVDVSCV